MREEEREGRERGRERERERGRERKKLCCHWLMTENSSYRQLAIIIKR